MTFEEQLYSIKKKKYSEVNIEQKFAMIVKLVNEHQSTKSKWAEVFNIFANTKLHTLVAEAYVREMLEKYHNNSEVTFQYKIDMVTLVVDQFGKFVDVDSIIKDVYKEQYPKIIEGIKMNHLLTLSRLGYVY